MRKFHAAIWAALALAITGCNCGSSVPVGVDTVRSTLEVDRAEGVVANGEDAVTITVKVQGSDGAPMAGVGVRLEISGTGNVLSEVPPTDANGVSTATLRSSVAELKELTGAILADAGGEGEGTRLEQVVTVRFVPGPADRLAFAVPPGNVQAGEAIAPAVQVRITDALGNLVETAAATIRLELAEPPAGAMLSGTAAVETVSGVATFPELSIAQAGKAYVLEASATGLQAARSPAFDVTSGAPARLAFLLQPVSGTAGEAFAVQVSLHDEQGNFLPQSSAEVSLALAGGPAGATLGGTTTVTAQEGVAAFTGLVVQQAGADYTLAATASGFKGATSAPFTLTPATVSAGTSTLVASPASVVADGAEQVNLTFVARDAFGNPVPAVAVDLSSSGNGNTFSASSGNTDASGSFTAALTSTVAEAKTVTANFAGSTITADVTFVPGAPDETKSTLTVSPAALVANGVDSTTVTVEVRDAFGNPAPGAAIALAASGSDNTLSSDTGTSDALGAFTAQLKSTRAEQKTVTATIAGFTLSQQVTFQPGAPDGAQSTLTANPASATADGQQAIVLELVVRDPFGNPIPGAAVAFTSSGTSATFAPADSGTTDAAGLLSVQLTSTVAETKTITATFAGQSLQADVEFLPGAPSQLTSTLAAAPAEVVADGSAAASLTFTARDAHGNLLTGLAVTLSASGSANGFTQASGTTDGSGVFTSSLTSTVAEAKTVTASFTGGSVTATVTFAAGAPEASKSTITASPAAATADGVATIALTVTLRDAHDNLVPGRTVSLASTGTANTFSPQSGTTDSAGVFASTLASTVAQAKTVTASFDGGTSTTTVTFNPGAPSPLTSTIAASPASATANGSAAITLTVTLRDGQNNPIPGAAVSLSSSGSANAFNPASGTTGANGVLTSSLSSTVAGTKTVTASFSGGTVTTPVTFTAGAPVQSKSTFTATPATATADGSATIALALTLRDAHDNLVPGQAVSLSASGSANVFSAQSGTTNASGLFAATLASTKAEAKTLTASFPGGTLTAGVTFTPGAPAPGKSSLNASPATATANGSSAITLTLTLRDANDNLVPGRAVSFSSTGSANTFAPQSGSTNASGVLTTALTSTAAGGRTVTASFTGGSVTAAVTFTPGAPVPGKSTFTASPGSATANGTAAIALKVTLRDANDNVVPGQAVSLTSTGTGNTLSPPNGTTDGTGVFSASLTSTVAGSKSLTATFPGGTLSATATFTPGAPSATSSSFTASPASATADGSSAIALTLTLRDANGNVIPGATAGFASTGTGNTISPASGTTGSNGVFSASFTSTVAQAKTVTATFPGGTLNAAVTFASGAPAQGNSTFTASPATVTADGSSASTLTITLRDANGNPVAGQTVSVDSTGTAHSLSPGTGTTDASGRFISDFRSTKAEMKTVTATAGAVSLTTSVAFVPGSADLVQSSFGASPSSVRANGTDQSTLTLTVRDAFGNAVVGEPVALSVTGSANTLTPDSGATGVDGTFVATLASTLDESKTVTATFSAGTLDAQVVFHKSVARTFSTCTATGRVGPSQAQCDAAYASSQPGEVTVTSGIQYWTVPFTATYRIEAFGAKGGGDGHGTPGNGARMRGDFQLAAGQTLAIAVGQMGDTGGQGGGGGGGTFIVSGGQPLLIAGGGGGAHYYNQGSMPLPGHTGQNGTSNPSTGTGYTAGSGGGFSADGANGDYGAQGGRSWANGLAGGTYHTSGAGHWSNGNGGFGGGGGGCWAPGSGGGYQGGISASSYGNETPGGGGGGSFNAGTNQSNATGANAGQGRVTISTL